MYVELYCFEIPDYDTGIAAAFSVNFSLQLGLNQFIKFDWVVIYYKKEPK